MVVVQLRIQEYSGKDYKKNVERIYEMAKSAIEDEHDICHSTVEIVIGNGSKC